MKIALTKDGMRKTTFTFCAVMFCFTGFAQQEIGHDSLRINRTPLEVTPELQKYMDTNETLYLNPEVPEFTSESYIQDSIHMQIPSLKYNRYIYSVPLITSYANPFAYDYRKYGAIFLSPQSTILTSHTRNTYPTMGNIIKTDIGYNYQFSEYISLNAGVYGAKYSVARSIMNDFGFNGGLTFKVNDRVRLHAIGRYSVLGNKNQIGGPMSPFYPNSAYGGVMEFKLTDKFGLGAGIEREFDPVKRKWTNKPILYPIFYK